MQGQINKLLFIGFLFQHCCTLSIAWNDFSHLESCPNFKIAFVRFIAVTYANWIIITLQFSVPTGSIKHINFSLLWPFCSFITYTLWLKLCFNPNCALILIFNLFSSLIQDWNPELRMTLRRLYQLQFASCWIFRGILSFYRLSSTQRYLISRYIVCNFKVKPLCLYALFLHEYVRAQ